MALAVIDRTFYFGKAEGGIDSYTKIVGSDTWEVQELLDDKGKVYYRLWILWNDITTRDYFTKIRRQFLATVENPASSYSKPF